MTWMTLNPDLRARLISLIGLSLIPFFVKTERLSTLTERNVSGVIIVV